MNSVLRTTGALAYSAFRMLGGENAVAASDWRQHQLLILCWHGISLRDEHQWRPGLYISPEVFRSRMEVLARDKYNVLSLDEAVTRLNSNDLPPKSVVITFDDGFYDFYVHAAPVMESFGFPSTLYLTTHYVNHQYPLPNLMLSYILWKGAGPGRSLPDGSLLETPAQVQEAHARIMEGPLHLDVSSAEKNASLREIATHLHVDYDALLKDRLLHLMTQQEVTELSAKGLVSMEAHTHRHRTPIDLDLMRRELEDNNRCIEQLTGKRPNHFCYPSGVYRSEYFSLFESFGYRSATTCVHGLANHKTNAYLIPRLLDHQGLSDLKYRAWLSGLPALRHRSA